MSECNSDGKSRTKRVCVYISGGLWDDAVRDLVATEGGTTVSREDGSLRMHDDITESSKNGVAKVCGVEYDIARMCEIVKSVRDDLDMAVKELKSTDKEE